VNKNSNFVIIDSQYIVEIDNVAVKKKLAAVAAFLSSTLMKIHPASSLTV